MVIIIIHVHIISLISRSLTVINRYVISHPKVKTWVKFAKFEERQNMVANARTIFEKALEYLGEEAHDEKLFISFATFEERCKEVDIYSFPSAKLLLLFLLLLLLLFRENAMTNS